MATALDPRAPVHIYEIDPVKRLAAPDGASSSPGASSTSTDKALFPSDEMGKRHRPRTWAMSPWAIHAAGYDRLLRPGNALRHRAGDGPVALHSLRRRLDRGGSFTTLLAARLSRYDEIRRPTLRLGLAGQGRIGTDPQKSLFSKRENLTQSNHGA